MTMVEGLLVVVTLGGIYLKLSQGHLRRFRPATVPARPHVARSVP